MRLLNILILAMRLRGLFLTLIVLYIFSSFYGYAMLYPYGLLAALFHRLNNITLSLTLIVGISARRGNVYKQFSNQFALFHLQNCIKK